MVAKWYSLKSVHCILYLIKGISKFTQGKDYKTAQTEISSQQAEIRIMIFMWTSFSETNRNLKDMLNLECTNK